MIEPPHEWLLQEIDGTLHHPPTRGPAAFLAGSFNPLHQGHRILAEVASGLLHMPVAFEISIANVDKPQLANDEIRSRLRQFAGWAPVYLTHAPKFVMKAALFPGSVMVIGSDTAVRIIDPRYYGNDERERDRALQRIAAQGCHFLVAGRAEVTGQFLALDEIEVPAGFRHLFKAITEAEFRQDISSTELRQRTRCEREKC